jgi:uncharacterized membrane protein
MTPQDQQQQSPIQAVPSKESVRDQDKIHLILSYIGILCLIPLLTVKDSNFVQFHAKQGVVLLIANVALSIIFVIPIIGQIVGCVGYLASFVLAIMGIIKALNGERWQLPLIGQFASKF